METFEKSAAKLYKNTLFLYGRMFFLMLITLFTSRLTLQCLGVTDFGIYNVVAGVITILSFLSNSMALSVNRFLAFEMGKGNIERLKLVFSVSLVVHVIIAIFALAVGETLGQWFLNTKLSIPSERMVAANWIYQFSILSFIFTIFRVPFNAAIIAHEDMKVYTYLGIVEGLLRLGIVSLLLFMIWDKLIVYGLLFSLLTISISIFYLLYCIRKYRECSFQLVWDTLLFKEMLAYAGISTMGNLSSVVFDQGQNIILNMFFGPVVNAARGISYQVSTAVSVFVNNIYTAATPQITKSFAANDRMYLEKIVNGTTILSMIILVILISPVMVNLPVLLHLWLGTNVPDSTIIFCRYILVGIMMSNICRPLLITIQSSGNIWRVHLYTSLIIMSNIPIDYMLLKYFKIEAYQVFIVYLISLIFFVAVILWLSNKQLLWDVKYFLSHILLPLMMIFPTSVFFVYFMKYNFGDSIFAIVFEAIINAFVLIALLYFGFLSREQRIFVKKRVLNLINK
jgi:O-antigen/teichoic acid export membrane protein